MFLQVSTYDITHYLWLSTIENYLYYLTSVVSNQQKKCLNTRLPTILQKRVAINRKKYSLTLIASNQLLNHFNHIYSKKSMLFTKMSSSSSTSTVFSFTIFLNEPQTDHRSTMDSDHHVSTIQVRYILVNYVVLMGWMTSMSNQSSRRDLLGPVGLDQR